MNEAKSKVWEAAKDNNLEADRETTIKLLIFHQKQPSQDYPSFSFSLKQAAVATLGSAGLASPCLLFAMPLLPIYPGQPADSCTQGLLRSALLFSV